jgi:hypothetical protein
MPISQGDQLFLLIKSMSKSEKRSFTAYVTRFQDGQDLHYYRLFEELDKQKKLNEPSIIQKLDIKDQTQYSNLKRHLYKQVLTSMRIAQMNKIIDIEIRELLDFVDILYNRGLYLQSLKILHKAKALAQRANNDILYLSIVETEKNIESKHITRTGTNITDALVGFTDKAALSISNASKLSNLRLLLHSYYIQNGHVQSLDEEEKITSFLNENMPPLQMEALSYIEKIYLHQSYVWYYYILLDFVNCRKHAEQWLLIADESNTSMLDPDLYMRGYHYLLTSYFYLSDAINYKIYLDKIELFRKTNYHKFSQNSKIISFLYVHHGRLNYLILTEDYQAGVEIINRTLRRISLYKAKLDPHRIMVFYFKIAWIYLMADQPSKSIDYLNEIFKMEMGTLRRDIQAYSQLMFIMAHYDLSNEQLLDYLIANAKNFFKKSEQVNRVQTQSLKFFTKLIHTPDYERKAVFQDFYTLNKELKTIKYEKRAYLYLDVSQWLEKKLLISNP